MADFNTLPTNDFFGGIDVMAECCTGYSAPAIIEDSLGNYLMYVGSEQGWIYQYNNIENNLDGSFNLVDSLYLNGVNVNVSGTDLNNNGKTEMVYGEFAGGIGLLENGIPQGIGIQKNNQNKIELTLNPNPAGSFINVNINGNKIVADFEVEIYNAYGMLVKRNDYTISSGQRAIDIRELAKGMYVINLKSKDGFGTAKFIKK